MGTFFDKVKMTLFSNTGRMSGGNQNFANVQKLYPKYQFIYSNRLNKSAHMSLELGNSDSEYKFSFKYIHSILTLSHIFQFWS